MEPRATQAITSLEPLAFAFLSAVAFYYYYGWRSGKGSEAMASAWLEMAARLPLAGHPCRGRKMGHRLLSVRACGSYRQQHGEVPMQPLSFDQIVIRSARRHAAAPGSYQGIASSSS